MTHFQKPVFVFVSMLRAVVNAAVVLGGGGKKSTPDLLDMPKLENTCFSVLFKFVCCGVCMRRFEDLNQKR